MVGIEPREKNIQKGKIVRDILKIENNVDYRIGDIESLEGETYDIVLCCGVLYHVESIPTALRNIRAVCNKMLFVESRCLSSHFITEELKAEIEMRDLIYQFNEEICGLTAQKYESSYYDGSTAKTTIVNVPSTESLIMNLKILGYDKVEVVADPDTYRSDVWQNKRPLGGVCISATLTEKSSSIDKEEEVWISTYERALENQILPREFLESLYNKFCKNEDVTFEGNMEKVVTYISSSEDDAMSIDSSWLPKEIQNGYALEIVKNFRYRPSHKIALEYGKLLKNEGKLSDAVEVLKTITTQLNADWRSVYRANHLIYLTFKEQGNQELTNKHMKLTLQGNPKYPL